MDQPSRLQRAEAAVDRFIAKSLRVNKPLTSFMATDEAKRFTAQFRDAIRAQVKWTAQFLEDNARDRRLTPAPGEEMTDQQKTRLSAALSKEMPGVAEFVSADQVASYLTAAFSWGVVSNYRRQGIVVKAKTSFKLTNPYYISQIKNQSNYLLHRSQIDDTTRDQMIKAVADGLLDGQTLNEVSAGLSSHFDEVSTTRADMIARTETANAMGDGNLASMKENGVQMKSWVTAGSDPCETCIENESASPIPVDQSFPSGEESEPAHPNCECYTEGEEINLESISIWPGD